MNPRTQIPTQITDVPYEDLTGLVERDPTYFPAQSGGYADIYIGRYPKNAKSSKEVIKVAIKVLRVVKDDPDIIKKINTYLIRETVVWTRLSHPNILSFLGLANDQGRDGCPALISPFCQNGEVMRYLKNGDPQLESMVGKSQEKGAVRLRIMAGVAQGLLYLHTLKDAIVHGDLKPSNILIDDLDQRPLLCDFGRSQIDTQGGFTTRASGAIRYQAPELFPDEDEDDSGRLKTAVDVYAFAITCSEVGDFTRHYYESINDLTGHVKRDNAMYPAYSGGYADVWIGSYAAEENTKVKVAIKVLRLAKDDPAGIQQVKIYLIRETLVWINLKHPNVLGFFGLADDLGREGCPALISPFCENGPIMNYLKSHPEPSESLRLRMMAGVAEGLIYLHNLKENIIHGDLKPSATMVKPSFATLVVPK
ncbi:hypothetical protein NP233_g10418 [Leucocoprinus birnbaumii]|uniref:Protein kinase domain-containing protein n=1 Tax=Leucocoprinus birnbaumii TaxID=56174 RepID=A0AAD5VIV1_9AGAR|nr:hypothetical protein NP233_g10418 [Leucocoprinus birnbaumii]